MAKLTDFNTAERYESIIREKAEEVRKLCIQEGIPCFMAFGLISQTVEEREKEAAEKEEETKEKRKRGALRENEYDIDAAYVTEEGAGFIHTTRDKVDEEYPYELKCVQAIPEVLPAYLYDRRFSDFINIVNGFRAIPKSERLSSDIEEEIIQLPDTNFQKELLGMANEILEDGHEDINE